MVNIESRSKKQCEKNNNLNMLSMYSGLILLGVCDFILYNSELQTNTAMKLSSRLYELCQCSTKTFRIP